ncbi:MAG: hypothetical protein ACM3X6_03555 [Patescibacteria group bacterium]
MLYRPDVDEVVERYRRYWAGEMRDQVLILATLAGEDIFASWLGWPSYEDTFARFDAFFQHRLGIEDDTIPVALPGLGLGPWGGMFGAEVTLMPSASSSIPFPSIQAVLDLVLDKENYWVKRQLDSVAYFCEHAKGRFAVAPAETISGVNVLYALRGSEVFADLAEDPEACLKVIDLVRPIGIWMAEEQKKMTGSYRGGVFDHWQVWLPGNPVWFSVDMNSLCSPAYYDRFGFHDTQAFLDHFGGGFIHVHKPTGLYLLPQLVKHRHVAGFEFYHDLGSLETCFTGLREIRDMVGTGLLVDCDFAQFTAQLEQKTLPGGIIYEVKNCPGAAAANELVARARAYRDPGVD